MRVHMAQKRMTFAQADTLLYYLHSFKYVTSVQVRERTGDAIICYVGDREAIIDRLRKFHYEDVEMPAGLIENSGRKVTRSIRTSWSIRYFSITRENSFCHIRSGYAIQDLHP